MHKDGQKDGISRRDVLKISVSAGLTLAAGAGFNEALAAVGARPTAQRPEAAKAHFLKSNNCSQAILESYAPSFGITPEMAGKLATGFAGGMAAGHQCGAVTAAYMVLGLAYGPKERKVFGKMEEFNREFKARHRELGCSQLLGIDMSTREGIKQAKRKGYFTTRCPEYVKTAGELLEKMLA